MIPIREESERAQRAFLVAAYSEDEKKKICEEHLDELAFLAETYGLEAVGREACLLKKIDASTYIGKGKVERVIEGLEKTEADLVVIDEEISPAQQRNLEKAFDLPVFDRTALILGVFAQRAHTKEAKLQVELAQTQYQYPRLKQMWTHLSRQVASGGGSLFLKGAGEKQIEIDRRLVRKRIVQLEKKIAQVKHQRELQRSLRKEKGMATYALIGYTNAGKSTLLNALTEAEVLVEDKLFATLDTTTRKFELSNRQEVLLIDTVGFIRKLPHLVVASFRSTLEEALEADILLHLIDASHPMALEHAEAAYQVLKELNAENKPIITVLNKVDQCKDRAMITKLRVTYPKIVIISALKQKGLDELEKIMIETLQSQFQKSLLSIPQSDYNLISRILKQGHIISQDYEENNVVVEALLPTHLYQRLMPYMIEEMP